MGDHSRKLEQLRHLVAEWDGKQGHDRCHYYPDIFRRIAEVLELPLNPSPELPPVTEFELGCFRFTDEEFNGVPTTPKEIGQRLRQLEQRREQLLLRAYSLVRRHTVGFQYSRHSWRPATDCEKSPIGLCLFEDAGRYEQRQCLYCGNGPPHT